MKVYCECDSEDCKKFIDMPLDTYRDIKIERNTIIVKGCSMTVGDILIANHGTWLEVKENE